MVVYLWVTGDLDYIKKCKTRAEAETFRSKMSRIGYYARIMTATEAKPYVKLARW